MNTAQGALGVAQANLAREKAGAWSREIDVARAKVDQARADIQALQIRIDRMTVRSPIVGTVIKRNVEPGEYAAAAPTDASNPTATGNQPAPAMVVGDIAHLNVRAQVDETDAALIRFGEEAVARPRGPSDVNIPLKMIRIEPLAIPKTQLTGLVTELVDTRVIEVIFRVQNPKGIPLYPGQLVDVFVNTDPPESPGNPRKPTFNERELHPPSAGKTPPPGARPTR